MSKVNFSPQPFQQYYDNTFMVDQLLQGTCFSPSFVRHGLPDVVRDYHLQYRNAILACEGSSHFAQGDIRTLQHMVRRGFSTANVADMHARLMKSNNDPRDLDPANKSFLKKIMRESKIDYLYSIYFSFGEEFEGGSVYFSPQEKRVRKVLAEFYDESPRLGTLPIPPPKPMQQGLRIQFGPAAPLLCFCEKPVEGSDLGLMHELGFHPLIMGLNACVIDERPHDPDQALSHDYQHLLYTLSHMPHWGVVTLSMLRRHIKGTSLEKDEYITKRLEELFMISPYQMRATLLTVFTELAEKHPRKAIKIGRAYLEDMADYKAKLDRKGWRESYAREMKAIRGMILDSTKPLKNRQPLFL